MMSSSLKTILVVAIVGPFIGFATIIACFLPGFSTFAEVIELARELKLEGTIYIVIVSEILSLLVAGSFIVAGLSIGYLPMWSAFAPGLVGGLFLLVFYGLRSFRSLGGAHGPFDLLIIGPAMIVFLIGLVSYFLVHRFWKQEPA